MRKKKHTESLTFANRLNQRREQGVYFQDWKKYKPWGIKQAKEKSSYNPSLGCDCKGF